MKFSEDTENKLMCGVLEHASRDRGPSVPWLGWALLIGVIIGTVTAFVCL